MPLQQACLALPEVGPRSTTSAPWAEGHFVAHALRKFIRRVRRIVDIFSAPLRVFNWAIDTFLWYFLERNERVWEVTTISNSVDTGGVCWLFGWGHFNDQSANKTRKKAENLKFEIWFADDQEVHMRLQTLKVSLKMLMSYFYESRSGVWRRSWDIRYDNKRQFTIWSYFTSTLK